MNCHINSTLKIHAIPLRHFFSQILLRDNVSPCHSKNYSIISLIKTYPLPTLNIRAEFKTAESDSFEIRLIEKLYFEFYSLHACFCCPCSFWYQFSSFCCVSDWSAPATATKPVNLIHSSKGSESSLFPGLWLVNCHPFFLFIGSNWLG